LFRTFRMFTTHFPLRVLIRTQVCVCVRVLLLLLCFCFCGFPCTHTFAPLRTSNHCLSLALTHALLGRTLRILFIGFFSQLHTHLLRYWLHRTCAVHLSCQLTAISQLIGALYRRNENQNRLPDMWFYGSKRKRAGLLFNSFALRCDRYRPM